MGCGKSNSITEDEENGILKTTVEILSNEIKRLEAENENLKEEINKLKEKGGKEDESFEPVKKLTAEEKRVVGSYERSDTPGLKLVFLENGKSEEWFNGKKLKEETWKIVGKEVQTLGQHMFNVGHLSGTIYRIEINGDLTQVAFILGGGRMDHKIKLLQLTYKKLK